MGVVYLTEDGCVVCSSMKPHHIQPFMDVCDDCRAKGFVENPNGPKGLIDSLFWKPFIKLPTELTYEI